MTTRLHALVKEWRAYAVAAEQGDEKQRIVAEVLTECAEQIDALLGEVKKPRTGRCEEKRKPGGCQLHNLQCGYPKCDEYLADALAAWNTRSNAELREQAGLMEGGE